MSPQTAEPTVAAAPSNGAREVMELDMASGMTCGSCAARVRAALARQPGVTEALVNYATGRATVELELEPGAADVQQLTAAVHSAGYGAAPAASSASEQAHAFEALEREEAREQAELVGAIALAVPLATAIAVLTYTEPHGQARARSSRRWRSRAVLVRAAVPALGVGARASRSSTWTR